MTRPSGAAASAEGLASQGNSNQLPADGMGASRSTYKVEGADQGTVQTSPSTTEATEGGTGDSWESMDVDQLREYASRLVVRIRNENSLCCSVGILRPHRASSMEAASAHLSSAAKLFLPMTRPRMPASKELAYTNGIMRETLRLYPPGAAPPRFSKEDFALAGYCIPAGTPSLSCFPTSTQARRSSSL